MIRKPPRNDVENPAGQLRWCECGDRLHKDCPGEWEPGCDMGANEQHIRKAVNQGKPLVKELSEYEEILRKNNSENSR